MIFGGGHTDPELSSLQRRATGFGLLMGVIVASMAMAFSWIDEKSRRHEVERQIDEFAALLPTRLKKFEYETIGSAASILMNRAEITKVLIKDVYGFVIFDKTKEAPVAASDSSDTVVVETLEDGRKGRELGRFYVEWSETGLVSLFLKSAALGLMGFIATLLLAYFLLTYYIRRFVTEPIGEMSDAMAETLATGQHVKTGYKSNSRLGRFAEQFNAMQNRLAGNMAEKERLLVEKETIAAQLGQAVELQRAEKERHVEEIRILGEAIRVSDQWISYFNKESGLIYSSANDLPSDFLRGLMTGKLKSKTEVIQACNAAGMQVISLELQEKLLACVFALEISDPDSEVWLLQRLERTSAEQMLICKRITGMRQFDRRMRQFEKSEAIGAAVSGVAHDINNLLAVIRGNIEILARTNGDNLHRRLSGVLTACDASTAIVRSLIGFAREAKIEQKLHKISVLVEDCRPLLESILQPVVKLEVRQLTDGHLLIDSGIMKSSLANLVINARDAMVDGGTVTIEVRRATSLEKTESGMEPDTNAVTISVRDNGPGVPPELVHRIFDPFFTTKDSASHSGLGLASAYGFAQQSGGYLTYAEAPGGGAEFRFVLPSARDGSAESAASPAVMQSSPRRSARILAVDDNIELLELAVEVLTVEGYDVVAARSVKEAIKALDDNADDPFDVAICDLNLRDESGVDILRFVKEKGIETPIVLVTGNNFHGRHRTELFADFAEIIMKPIDFRVLGEKVEALLAERAKKRSAN